MGESAEHSKNVMSKRHEAREASVQLSRDLVDKSDKQAQLSAIGVQDL